MFIWTPVFLLKGFSSAFYKETPIAAYNALGYSQPKSMAVTEITQEDIKCTLFWYEWSVCKIQDSCEKLIN